MNGKQQTAYGMPCKHPDETTDTVYATSHEIGGVKMTCILTVNAFFPPEPFGRTPYWHASVAVWREPRRGTQPERVPKFKHTWKERRAVSALLDETMRGIGEKGSEVVGSSHGSFAVHARRALSENELRGLAL